MGSLQLLRGISRRRLVYSQMADEHLEHIGLVLRELQRHHLHIKLSKCCFG
jgi:hypothetical protein